MGKRLRNSLIFTNVSCLMVLLCGINVSASVNSPKPATFIIESKTGSDTFSVGESMAIHIVITYTGKGKFCLQNTTDITFVTPLGWEQKGKSPFKIINGPLTITGKKGESFGYNPDLKDYFTKIISGKYMLKFQVELHPCGKNLPIALTDSVQVIIKN